MTGLARKSVFGMTLAIASVFSVMTAKADDAGNLMAQAPATAAEIWKGIDEHLLGLKSIIVSGKLGEAHLHAFAIRDLVRTLPEHSQGLSADALATVTADVKFVDALADRLDQAGDANDKEGVESNLTKLEDILNSMRSLYGAIN